MWPFSSKCQSKIRLVGKTVVITGGDSGIGKETVRDLYRRGARVILACLYIDEGNAAVEDLKKNLPSRPEREQFNGEPGELVVCHLNLCSLASVRECAKLLNDTEPNIHILINNAGIMMCPYGKTEDGYETQFQTNYLGHFLFTILLLPKMIKSAPARIANVASLAHSALFGDIHFDDINFEKSYGSIIAYSQSKLATVLFTKELDRRLKNAKIQGVNSYSLHPGVVKTNLGHHMGRTIFPGAFIALKFYLLLFGKSPELGAQTTLHCATSEEAGEESGLYYRECGVETPSAKARNPEMAKKLWDLSAKMVGWEPKDNLVELLTAAARDIAPKK